MRQLDSCFARRVIQLEQRNTLAPHRVGSGVEDIKVRRRHAWVAVTTHNLTQEQAEASMADAPVLLTNQMVQSVRGPVCFYCERSYDDAAESCPGEASP